MKLAWGKKVDQAFRDKVFSICEDLDWDPETHASWLMGCIAFESAETFSPSIVNRAGSGATGLIQFMPATARGLGTSTTLLAQMTAVGQLNFVQQYFYPYAPHINSLSDMYLAILLPKFVGKPDDSVMFLNPKISYRQNAGLDANKDGRITKGEAASKVLAKFNRGMQDQFALDVCKRCCFPVA